MIQVPSYPTEHLLSVCLRVSEYSRHVIRCCLFGIRRLQVVVALGARGLILVVTHLRSCIHQVRPVYLFACVVSSMSIIPPVCSLVAATWMNYSFVSQFILTIIAVSYLLPFVPSCINFTIETWAIHRSSATTGALFMTLEPALTASFSWIILHEAIRFQAVIGACVVVLGILLSLPSSEDHSDMNLLGPDADADDAETEKLLSGRTS